MGFGLCMKLCKQFIFKKNGHLILVFSLLSSFHHLFLSSSIGMAASHGGRHPLPSYRFLMTEGCIKDINVNRTLPMGWHSVSLCEYDCFSCAPHIFLFFYKEESELHDFKNTMFTYCESFELAAGSIITRKIGYSGIFYFFIFF